MYSVIPVSCGRAGSWVGDVWGPPLSLSSRLGRLLLPPNPAAGRGDKGVRRRLPVAPATVFDAQPTGELGEGSRVTRVTARSLKMEGGSGIPAPAAVCSGRRRAKCSGEGKMNERKGRAPPELVHFTREEMWERG